MYNIFYILTIMKDFTKLIGLVDKHFINSIHIIYIVPTVEVLYSINY
jgi:hypothetical protein